MKNAKQKTYIDVKFKGIFVAATFSMLIEYLMSLSDKIISGHMIGSGALSAITLVEPFTLLTAFAACVLSGITGAPVASAIGKGDQKKAEQYFSQSLLLAVGIGAILMTIYLVFTDKLVAMVAGSSAQAGYVRDYFLWLRFLPIPMLLNAVIYPVALYRGGEQYCNISAVCSVVFNIGSSIVLCHFIGLQGIGIGTVAGSTMGLIPLILFFLSPKGKMKLSFYISLRDIRNNLIYSLGNSLTYFYMAIFQMALNAFLMAKFDDSAIVIFTGVINVVGLVSALSNGIVEFLIPMLNTYQGEQNELGCKRVMEKSLKASITESLVLTIILIVFARALARVFGVDDPTLASKFAGAVRIYALSSCFFYVVDLYSKYYLYAGKAVLSLGIGCLKSLIFPMVFGLGFGTILGLNGIWIGMCIAQVVLLFACYFVLRANKKAGKDLLFLDQEALQKQFMWNIEMNKDSIMQLTANVRAVLEKEGLSTNRINKAALAIEESQMRDLALNKDPQKQVIECSLLIGNSNTGANNGMNSSTNTNINNDVTLILRNTGVCSNILENQDEDPLSSQIVVGLFKNTGSYILVNGNNRLIFHI